jgi:hypothetical protein
MPTDTPPKRGTRSGSTTAALSLNDIKILIDNVRSEIIHTVKDEVSALKTSITELQSIVGELQSQNKRLEERCLLVERELSAHQKNCNTSEIFEEMEDRARRSKNIIISGIPELSPDSSKDEATKKDLLLSMEVLSTLGCKDNTIVDAQRVGKPGGERPRLLRVKCSSSEQRDNILRRAKDLRKCPNYRDVFINVDRTPFQQKRWKEMLLELKRRRDNAEDVVIFRNRIVPRQRQNFRPPF